MMESNMTNRVRPFVLLVPAGIVMAVFVIAFLTFITISFLHPVPNSLKFVGPWSLSNYTHALSSAYVRNVAIKTIWMSVEMVFFAAVIGYPLAYLLVRSSSATLRGFILFGLVMTFLSGGVTRAYAWLMILGNSGLVNQTLKFIGLPTLKLAYNETSVLISVTHLLIPFFVLTLYGGLKTIPSSLDDAARNLGATRLQAFLRVTFPLSLPSVVAASSLTFAVASSSFLFPDLLGGGRVKLASNLIYDSIITNYDLPTAAALSVLFLILVLAVLAALTRTGIWLQTRKRPALRGAAQ